MKTKFLFLAAVALAPALISTPSQAIEIVDPFNNGYVNKHGDTCVVSIRTRLKGVDADRAVVINKWVTDRDDFFWVELVDANGNLIVPSQVYFEHLGVTNNRKFDYSLPLSQPLAMPIRHRVYETAVDTGDIASRGALLVDREFSIWSFENGKCHAIIGPSNTAPIADAGLDQEKLASSSVVTLNGTQSSDPENDPLTYSWTQISGPAVTLNDPSSATPTFTLPLDAATTPIVFELVVNDGIVDSAPDQVVISANAPPVADAGTDITGVKPNQDVTLDGTASVDGDGDNITYLWTQISGLPVTLDDPTSPTPTFTVPPGKVEDPWVFELTVSDGSETSTSTVTVYHQGLSKKGK